MRALLKLMALCLVLSTPAAWAGLKWKDCVNSPFMEWREYLVGGAQGATGNELWGRGTVGTCGVELWDLTLKQVSVETAPSGYLAKYVTQYEDGFVGVNLGPYASIVHWNVFGTVTALLETPTLMHSVLALTGTSTEHPGEILEMELATDFDPTVLHSGCLPWDANYVAGPPACQKFSYIGDEDGAGKSTTITSSYVQVVPVPGTLALLAFGFAGLAYTRRRKQ